MENQTSSVVRIFALVAVAGVFGIAGSSATQLTLDIRSGAEHCLSAAEIELVSLSEEPGRSTLVPVEGQVVTLPGEGGPWRLRLSSPRCWAPELVVDPGTDVRLPVWPLGFVTGQLSSHHEGKPVRQLGATVSLVADQATRGPAEGEATQCSVTDNRRFTCRIPAAEVDMKLHAPGFAPLYLWGIAARPGERAGLGEVTFTPGASITGAVITDEGSAEGVEVRLEPVTFTPEGGATDRRLQRTAQSVLVRRGGFFQLSSVPPGTWRVVAGGDDWSSARSDPIRVIEASEHVLDHPLELHRLAELIVVTSPPVDPEGRPWALSLYRRMNDPRMLGKPVSREASPAGEARFDRLHEGEYVLEIDTASGSQMLRRDIPIDEAPPLLVLDLSGIPVRGVVMAGEEPLSEVDVELIRPDLDGTKRVFRTDGEGRFEGSLPEAGSWRAAILTGEHGRLHLETVEVEPPDDGSPCQLELQLPGTLISGRARWEDGAPCYPCGVRVRDPDARVIWFGTADREGLFRAFGFRAGNVFLQAKGVKDDGTIGMSQVLMLSVEEDEPTANIALTIRPTQQIEGVVTFRGRPVAGAVVQLAEAPNVNAFSKVYAGPTGVFRSMISPHTRELKLAVVAADAPSKLVSIQVPEPGVRFAIEIGEPARIEVPAPVGVTIEHGGVIGWPGLLLPPRPGLPGGRHLPAGGIEIMVEAGWYRLCRVDAGCVDGNVPPGGVLRLGLPQDGGQQEERAIPEVEALPT